MDFKVFDKEGEPTLLLIPGLGVSYEIFLPLIDLLKDRFRIIAVQVDGFTLGVHTRFTSIDDQAGQVITHIKERYGGRLDCAYGLSLGGKILSRMLERDEVFIGRSMGHTRSEVVLASPAVAAASAVKGWTCRPGRLQVCLYQQTGIHPRR